MEFGGDGTRTQLCRHRNVPSGEVVTLAISFLEAKGKGSHHIFVAFKQEST